MSGRVWRSTAAEHNRLRTRQAESRLAHRDSIKALIVERGIRTEVDENGRIVRASLPSKSNPNDPPYAMERSPRGVWMHTCSRCPAWIKGAKCWHIIVLEELCQEMENV